MKKKHIGLLLCLLWMAVIFWFSNQPAQESQGISNSFLKVLEDIFHIQTLTQGGWLHDMASFLIRKAAHMSEYAILGMLYAFTLRAYGNLHPWRYAILGIILYASSDEFHQLFIKGRSGQISDVGIDTLGGCIGLILLWGSEKFRTFIKKHKNA